MHRGESETAALSSVTKNEPGPPMATLPTIWFLRHGQTEWNRERRLQGHLDSPLTAQGIADAERQARLMQPILRDDPALFVSPLGRARQTAEIALAGADYRLDDRLKEIHAGDWQGALMDDLLASRPDWAAARPTGLEIYQAAPGGEGKDAFVQRIQSFLDDLTEPSVVVAHGLLGQVLRTLACGGDPDRAGQMSNRQGCVYLLEDGRETVLEPDT